jgi:hypothetical protein
MIRSLLFVLVLLIHFNLFSQKAEITFKSKFTHEYAIGYSYYVEDDIDTSKLFFVGIVEVISSKKDEYVSPAISLLNSKTKQLNGNAYRLKSYNIHDTTLILKFDVYFASEKSVGLMKLHGEKQKIVIFNNEKDSLNRILVVNNKSYSFPRNKRFEIFTSNKMVNLKLENDTIFKGTNQNVGKNKNSIFLTIKKKNVAAAIATGGAVGGVVGAIVMKEIVEGYPRNNSDIEIFTSLNYNTGRILMNLYPLHQQITIH